MDHTPRNSTEAPQVPSSVELGIEQSVTPYAETPLSQAYKDHLTDTGNNVIVPNPEAIASLDVNAPENTGSVLPEATAVTTTAEKEKQPMSRTKKIGLAIVGSVVAAGAAVPLILGLTTHANDSNKGTAPEKNDKDNSQVDSGNKTEQKPQVDKEKTAEELINENKIEAGLSAMDYAKALESRLANWAFAGTTNENFSKWVDAKSKVDFEDNLAASQTSLYTSALFAPGYQNEQSLVNAEANLTTRNSSWIASWMRSYDFQNHKGTLKLSSTVDEVRVISENPSTGERVIYIAGHDTSNAAEAKFTSEENRQKTLESDKWDHTLTLKSIDGKEYISKWEG